ncbi:uncharacterized protein [Ptychodera flava]|uniref:uncharacterized protein n=1 Tax=Ptychodera flava TaxID=63121 RepID=UPI003969E4F7
MEHETMDLRLKFSDPAVKKIIESVKHHGSNYVCLFWADNHFGSIPASQILIPRRTEGIQLEPGDRMMVEYGNEEITAIFIAQGAKLDEMAKIATKLTSLRNSMEVPLPAKRRRVKKRIDDFILDDEDIGNSSKKVKDKKKTTSTSVQAEDGRIRENEADTGTYLYFDIPPARNIRNTHTGEGSPLPKQSSDNELLSPPADSGFSRSPPNTESSMSPPNPISRTPTDMRLPVQPPQVETESEKICVLEGRIMQSEERLDDLEQQIRILKKKVKKLKEKPGCEINDEVINGNVTESQIVKILNQSDNICTAVHNILSALFEPEYLLSHRLG